MDARDRILIAQHALEMGIDPGEIEGLLSRVDAASRKARPIHKRKGFWPPTWDTAELPPMELR